MKPLVVIIIAIVVLTALPAFAQTPKPAPAAPKAPAAAKTWTPPKTPWGDPDLQGTWTSDDCIATPLNRPAQLGDRLYYTEQELADREKALARQAENDKQEFVAADARVGTGPPGHWGERARRPCRQTSLVVDPPDGRTPDVLSEAAARRIPESAGNNNPKADSLDE